MELKIGQDTGLKKFNQLEDKNIKKSHVTSLAT